jgi:hypothetical protein
LFSDKLKLYFIRSLYQNFEATRITFLAKLEAIADTEAAEKEE